MSVYDRLGPKKTASVYPKKRHSFGVSKEEEMNLPWKHDKFIPDTRSQNQRKYSVLVENLHPSATIQDVKASFAHLGNIVDAEYKLLLNDGQHVGSCVLSFDHGNAVQDAINEFDQKMADGYLLRVSRVSTVKSILGASSNARSNSGKSITGKMYSDRASHEFSQNSRLSGIVRDAAKKAAISTRLGGRNISSRLGPSSQTVRQVAAVDELDAQILDDELAQLLKQELIEIFQLEIPDWVLELLIYCKFTSGAYLVPGSYGSDMMNLKYLASSNHFLYLVLKVLVPCALSGIHNKKLAMAIKLVYFLHYLLYLIDGKYLYISHRMLGIKAVYKNPLKPRLLNSEFITRQVIWQGFTDFAVFIAPFVNWIKLRNWTRSSRKLKELPADTCALCLDKGYKSIKITNPYKTNCNHCYCYYCVQSEMIADSSWLCLICKSRVKSIKPKLD